MTDPRPAGIARRMAAVERVIAVGAGKGGVGKSSVAAVLALELAAAGVRTGLLDLDLMGPSAHLILGLEKRQPAEDFGLVPPVLHGIQLMSLQLFLGDRAAPLRGPDVTDTLIELLAITRWEDLEVLVLDLPPGLGDVTLDLTRYLPRAQHLIVAASSRVVIGTVRRALGLLRDLKKPVLGVIENLVRAPQDAVRLLARELGVPYLGALPFDPGLEAALGDPGRLRATTFAAALRPIARALLSPQKL